MFAEWLRHDLAYLSRHEPRIGGGGARDRLDHTPGSTAAVVLPGFKSEVGMANGWSGKRQGSGWKSGLSSPQALVRANPKLPDTLAKQHRANVGLLPVDLLLRAVRDEKLDWGG